MGAPKGNEYYLLRKTDGRNKAFTPDSLLEKANEYFNWCLDNPLMEATIQKLKVNGVGEEIKMVDLPKMRPFTLQGFCNFANIVIQTFHNYENPVEKGEEMTSEQKDLLEVTTRIRGIIENQQFEGAASGFLNPNIIARKLGLVDRKDIKSDDKALQEAQVVLPDGMSLEEYIESKNI